MKRTILTLIVLLLAAPASAAFLGENSRLGGSFLERRIEQVLDPAHTTGHARFPLNKIPYGTEIRIKPPQ